jgi:hypothetical protein
MCECAEMQSALVRGWILVTGVHVDSVLEHEQR